MFARQKLINHVYWQLYMQAYYNKGMRLYQLGRLDEAIENIKKARQLAPYNEDIENTIRVLEKARKKDSVKSQ